MILHYIEKENVFLEVKIFIIVMYIVIVIVINKSLTTVLTQVEQGQEEAPLHLTLLLRTD